MVFDIFDNDSSVYIDSIEYFLIAVYCNKVHNNSALLNILQYRNPKNLVTIRITDSDKTNCKYWLKEQGMNYPPTEEQLVEFKLKYL